MRRKNKEASPLPKVGVSKCLLGYKCRYDGGHKFDEELVDSLKGCQVIPFCPEEALGVPREPIDIVEEEVVGKNSKKLYTPVILDEAKKFIETHPDMDIFYLKSKSPSCALKSAKRYDKDNNLLSNSATGVFAKELKKWYKKAKFYER